MLVLVELAQLLFHNHEVVGLKLVDKQHKLDLARVHKVCRFRALTDKVLKLLKMANGDVNDFFRIATLHRLHLHTHEH